MSNRPRATTAASEFLALLSLGEAAAAGPAQSGSAPSSAASPTVPPPPSSTSADAPIAGVGSGVAGQPPADSGAPVIAGSDPAPAATASPSLAMPAAAQAAPAADAGPDAASPPTSPAAQPETAPAAAVVPTPDAAPAAPPPTDPAAAAAANPGTVAAAAPIATDAALPGSATAAAAAASSPAPILSFAGPSRATAGSLRPDPNIAVGIGQVVATVNQQIQWYDRAGNQQSVIPLTTLFNLPANTPIGDSRVVYDAINDRFVVESDAWNDRVLHVAVSKDGNPNDGWNTAAIGANVPINGQSTWDDIPSLATDGKAIYIDSRINSVGPDGVINSPDDAFLENHLWIINDGVGSGGIYDGGAPQVADFGAAAVTGGASTSFGAPTQIVTPTGSSLGTYLFNVSATGTLQIISIDNPTTAPVFQTQFLAGAPAQDVSNSASQPGTSALLDAHGFGNTVWLNGTLYAVHSNGPVSGPDAGIQTAHWYKIDTSNPNALSVVDQGDVGGSLLGAGAGVATFDPSIAADPAGDLIVNFNASGPNLFAGAYYALHAATDPAGSIQAPQPLHAGQDSYALANGFGDIGWGDFSGAAWDPVNQASFWIFNEYAAPRNGTPGNWATQIAQVPAPSAGGRWVFSTAAGLGGLVLGINNGAAPVFPMPQPGAFNIEVFTNPALAGQAVPGPETGFQSSLADPSATLDSGFLTGTDLRLTTGNLLLVDSVTGAASQGPSKVTLGSGSQTVVGARSDTLVGGSGSQILSALAGGQSVIGGSGNTSIWGGGGDSIVGGTGADQQIVLTAPLATLVVGMSGNAVISEAAQDTVSAAAGSTQNVVVAGGASSLIDLTGNTGSGAAIGAAGDTIIGGGGTTNVEGVAGGMEIVVGAAGTTNLSGSGAPGLGNTVFGGTGNLDFNPSAVAGAGDLINLSGTTGNATINAFAFGATRVASPDTILAGNGGDSVFGGAGDRIGTGNASVVGGTHQWTHADTLAGAAVGFGSNDTVASTAYDTVTGTATRGTAAGTSSAQVTVGGFNSGSDFLFYQNENAVTTANIIATSQATIVAGIASSVVTLPDGTVMTLVGVTQAQLTPTLFRA